LEQPVAWYLSENVPFQQYIDGNQLTYHGYKEESFEPTEGNPLPLWFYSFQLLK
jgi:hypothetical protein